MPSLASAVPGKALPAWDANRLLALLAPADRAVLAPDLRAVPLNRGDVLHDSGDIIEHVYFPLSGMISLLTVMRSGEAIETGIVGHEGIIGATAGLGSRFASDRATVQIPGTAARLKASRFRVAVSRSSSIREVVARYSELLTAQIQQSAACNILHGVEARLCRWLLQAHDHARSDSLPLTQEFMAQMLGVRRTTVTAVAQALQSARLIQYRRGHIQIANRKGLEESACECYATLRARAQGILAASAVTTRTG